MWGPSLADAKISQLPDGGAIQPSDQVPVNRAGTTMRATGATILAGAGSPNGVVTAAAYGDLYRDTSNGTLYVYVGDVGVDWICCAGDPDIGGSDLYPVGVSHTGTGLRLIAAAGKKAIISDAAAQANSGNGVYWNSIGAADGSQTLDVQTGPSSAFVTRVADAKGHMRPSTLVLTNHAAPADADLAAGDCALWFDQTNGTAKLMIKGKSADGTVVTGSVNLA